MPGGYRLDATDDVDAGRFEAMITQVRRHLTDRPARAVADLATALALWHGEPYADVTAGADVVATRSRLVELRLSALEDRLDAELALGRHARIVAELAGLVVEYPLRERLAGIYLHMLYRCGRIADAQAHYQELCRQLDAELGLEPGPDIAAMARVEDEIRDRSAALAAAHAALGSRAAEVAESARDLPLDTVVTELLGPQRDR